MAAAVTMATAAQSMTTATAVQSTAITSVAMVPVPVPSNLGLYGDTYEGEEAEKSRIARSRFNIGDHTQKFHEVVSSMRLFSLLRKYNDSVDVLYH